MFRKNKNGRKLYIWKAELSDCFYLFNFLFSCGFFILKKSRG